MTADTLTAAVLAKPPSMHRLIIAATIGNVFEWFDFVVYGFFAVTLSEVFFPTGNPTVSLLKWLATFARGLGKDADAFGCPLLGGDTDRTPGPVTISITVFGTLPQGTMVLRGGARVGQRVCVTGTIGDAALGLLVRRDSDAVRRWKLDRAQKAA